jgi:cytochrome c peroxidase
MSARRLISGAILIYVSAAISSVASAGAAIAPLDRALMEALSAAGFTGRIQQVFHSRIESTLGRPINPALAEIGRLLWFDTIHSLHGDNTCGGCHSPTNGFGDSQGIAIGVQSNGLVGPHRSGPRNQRRSPLVINAALYPALMWNGRFNAASGDPFDGSDGFRFPFPEADSRFSATNNAAHDVRHLLEAQAHMPPTELVEVAGFTGTCPDNVSDGTLGPAFCQFDDGLGEPLPPPDPATGSRNEPIREKALELLNATPGYRQLFGEIVGEVKAGAPIDFYMVGKAIAEFEFTLVFADAPLDRFARGEAAAMTEAQKRGALLFFGRAGCVDCHAVGGRSNEMFSDFAEHVVGVPQIAPPFGAGAGNVVFDGPAGDEDFGLEQVTGAPADRYKFRTAPLRNLALSPAFFHNGAYTRLEDAIRFHLNVIPESRTYDPVVAGVASDLVRTGPLVPVRGLDPRIRHPHPLTALELEDLVTFVKDALHDPRADPSALCRLVPATVPSGRAVLQFEGCR